MSWMHSLGQESKFNLKWYQIWLTGKLFLCYVQNPEPYNTLALVHVTIKPGYNMSSYPNYQWLILQLYLHKFLISVHFCPHCKCPRFLLITSHSYDCIPFPIDLPGTHLASSYSKPCLSSFLNLHPCPSHTEDGFLNITITFTFVYDGSLPITTVSLSFYPSLYPRPSPEYKYLGSLLPSSLSTGTPRRLIH